MPYILSPEIIPNSPGMWGEGSAYEKKSIYSLKNGTLPPVNYDEHILRPHSLTHLETPAHTANEGKRLESFFASDISHFYGPAVVIKLTGNEYHSAGDGIYHWIISPDQIESRIKAMGLNKLPGKVLITTENYPENEQGYHDPTYVLTLSQESAEYLVSIEGFNLYGTSWKSSDYNPGKAERPIHNTLFRRALILENLKLKTVPEGIYFLSAFPLPLQGASESPVVPVLFTKDELVIK